MQRIAEDPFARLVGLVVTIEIIDVETAGIRDELCSFREVCRIQVGL